MNKSDEIQKIIMRYSKRSSKSSLYNIFLTTNFLQEQEKELYIYKCIKKAGLLPVQEKQVLEIGAGMGGMILFLLKLGFKPENITVNELLEERIRILTEILPHQIKILEGNASDLILQKETFDIIIQSMVFTSILEISFKKELAQKLWYLLRPGGGILWYDFTFNNPMNSDVKGIDLKEIKSFFPEASIYKRRLTLAPPVARNIPESLYRFLHLFPFLKTHLLCWIRKN